MFHCFQRKNLIAVKPRMAVKSEQTLRRVTYAFLALNIVLFIAGVVMLVIGITNANKTGRSDVYCSFMKISY